VASSQRAFMYSVHPSGRVTHTATGTASASVRNRASLSRSRASDSFRSVTSTVQPTIRRGLPSDPYMTRDRSSTHSHRPSAWRSWYSEDTVGAPRAKARSRSAATRSRSPGSIRCCHQSAVGSAPSGRTPRSPRSPPDRSTRPVG
jgi:hypothetical protein